MRRLVGSEADVAAAEFVGSGNAEDVLDELPLMRVQRLAGCAHHAQLRQAQSHSARTGARSEQRDAARVAVDALRPERLHRIEIGVHVGRGHGEGIEHKLIQQPVAEGLDAIGLVQFGGRTPQIDFTIANIDAPPATSPDTARRIGCLASAAEIEDQRLAARAPRVVSGGAAGHAGPAYAIDVGARILLGHDGEPAQVIQRERRVTVIEIEAGCAHALGVPWAVPRRGLQ